MHLNDSLGAHPGLQSVCNLHEQSSALAAEAYSRVAGTLGVALGTAGPGGTNAVTGVAAAWLDSTPCLFLSGQVKRADLKGDRGVRQYGVQEIDIVSVVSSLTKYAVTVTDPASIRFHEKALQLARPSRPGPVWLDLPLDVQGAQFEPSEPAGYRPADAPAPPAAGSISAIVDLIRGATRPVVLCWNRIRIGWWRAAIE